MLSVDRGTVFDFVFFSLRSDRADTWSYFSFLYLTETETIRQFIWQHLRLPELLLGINIAAARIEFNNNIFVRLLLFNLRRSYNWLDVVQNCSYVITE